MSGEKVEELELNQEVFGVEIKDELIHQIYVSQASNRRQVLAHTKTRSDRQGSGKKPWKQKGTGRARAGTASSPIWRKGGVVFGPSNERNFKKKINRKMNKSAIKMALSGKLKDKELIVLSDNNFSEKKTKKAQEVLKNLGIEGSVLWAFEKKELDSQIVIRNLEKVASIFTDNINVYDMLNNKHLLITKEGIKKLEEKYGK
ncbi:MAG: 50S ribosomal protein L4 [Candidatus Moranbacteria bacterium]|nr:50S ribosomal protein L4 [Candidatus Moranbacteria bacterium]